MGVEAAHRSRKDMLDGSGLGAQGNGGGTLRGVTWD